MWWIIPIVILLILGAVVILGAFGMLDLWHWSLARDDKPTAEFPIIGDAALLDHPELPRPSAKPARREPEPMGA